MSTKQWVPNKRNALKATQKLYPFDGSVISKGNGQEKTLMFKFSAPGLINGIFPDNMWEQGAETETLLELKITSETEKWYLIATCLFSIGIVSVELSVVNEPPENIMPTANEIPDKAEIILWAGVGKLATKMVKGNVLVKPMLLMRTYRDDVDCGEVPFEDYYTMIAIS